MTFIRKSFCYSTIILATVLSHAQAPPQDGTFIQICSLHGQADQGQNAYSTDGVCDLPGDFHIDRTYHQQAATFAGGGAQSNLSIADIPAGIHIVASGNTYWSFVKPMGMVILDQDGPVVRRFTAHLYCGPQPPPGAGCSVHLDVYAKRKQ
jgi:hypothetical protein